MIGIAEIPSGNMDCPETKDDDCLCHGWLNGQEPRGGIVQEDEIRILAPAPENVFEETKMPGKKFEMDFFLTKDDGHLNSF